MIPKGRSAIFILSTLFLLACTRAPTQSTLTVFAAASLTDAFTEIAVQFEADHPGVAVVLNFAGSQQLAQQLSQGAPGDVFASANPQQMQVVVDNGRIARTAPITFAQNQLVVILPADNPADIATLTDLARPGVLLILAAPAVPVGQYSRDFLARAAADADFGPAYRDRVLANVVSLEQNVRTVFTKVSLGEADAGIVYSSDIIGVGADSVSAIPIPTTLNTSASYQIAPLSDSRQPDLAAAWIAFIRSAQATAVLESYGFLPPVE